MINKNSSRRWNINSKSCFCSEPWKIENYDKAIVDTTQVWECHHRLETHTSDGKKRLVDLTREELQALNMYYHRPPEEFIFLTAKDHMSLHKKGKHTPEEAKRKNSDAHKGSKNPMFGKNQSEETKRKMSAAHKGCTSYRKGLSWRKDPLTGKRIWYKKD